MGRAGSDALALSACGNARVASNSAAAVLLYAFQPLRRLPHTRVTRQIFFVSLAQHLLIQYLLKRYILHMHGDGACDNPRPSCAEERRRR